MKRADLVRHLKASGCVQLREGKRHTIFLNPGNGKTAPVPRHKEISNLLAEKICKELEIPSPAGH